MLLGVLIPVSLAIILSYIRTAGIRSAVQVIMLLPHFLSWVIVSYFVYAFLSPDRGFINVLLRNAGASPVNFYTEPAVWPCILVLTQLWKNSGYSMLLYYANIMGIDPELYDLAAVDGAGVKQVIRHVILPSLKNVITVMVILNLGHILSSDFGLFYQVTRNSGSIQQVTQTIDVFVFKALTEQSNYSFSAAAGLLQNGIGCVILLIADRMIKRIDPEGGVI
ncbi:MAG TPA: sugar ABC transporter permease [Lachnospiraceae bacterium]|nr:sugar ABC transporter permease [Lachnospiraceae bacterium]